MTLEELSSPPSYEVFLHTISSTYNNHNIHVQNFHMGSKEKHSAYSQNVLEWTLVYFSVALEYIYIHIYIYLYRDSDITVMGVFRGQTKQGTSKLQSLVILSLIAHYWQIINSYTLLIFISMYTILLILTLMYWIIFLYENRDLTSFR